ncbi:Hypothetical predicted protein [Mytilus galloprovincialis]|uniref:Uncharacterized protein n=1 Tax=Mytilus galloprovincialis TaxID=29158 RepID=A0A8B6DDQ9_MYTGA|nr:Hypothetical predicted protein [Mytilus galloprovincialis]
MHGAGTNMTMPCKLTSPIKFKIGDIQFNQQVYVAPVSCDMILGCDFIIQNKVVMNIGKLIVTVQNRNMPLILGSDNTAHDHDHEPFVNIVHGSDSSSDEKPSTEGSTQIFDTVVPHVESNLGMTASTSTQESDERGIQEKPDQCCIKKTYHSKRLLNDSGFHQHRAYVVMLIAKWLTGQETVTTKELVNFLNEKSFVPRSTHVTGIQMQVHRTVCKEMGWTDYFRYSLRPVNSPACLLNWRVLSSVLHFLSPEQQDMVAERFSYNPRNPPEPEELAEMNASFWPVFVNKAQDESAILQKEGEEDNV